MKRWILYAIALAAALALPTTGTELGELNPISLLYITKEDGQVCITTDLEEQGRGLTLQAAIDDLELTTSGHIFLNTVEHLVLTEDTVYLIPKLGMLLRPTVRVCLSAGELPLENLPEYLHTHVPKEMLMNNPKKAKLQNLSWKEGCYRLENRKAK